MEAKMLSSTDERTTILRMIDEQKITAEQGTQLLTALGNPSTPQAAPKAQQDPATQGRTFRVLVTDSGSGKVKTSVKIPLGLVRWGLKFGSRYSSEVEGVDMEELADLIAGGDQGEIIEVIDEEDGENVKIFIE
jgi:hypothetical protein